MSSDTFCNTTVKYVKKDGQKNQGRIQEFTKGEAVTAVDESPPQANKIFFHLQITVCEFYFIFGELKWIFF